MPWERRLQDSETESWKRNLQTQSHLVTKALLSKEIDFHEVKVKSNNSNECWIFPHSRPTSLFFADIDQT